MSTIIRIQQRPWIWWAAGGGILIAALALVGALALPAEEPTPSSDPAPPAAATGPDGQALPQAKWQVKVFPAGVGKPTKAQKKLVTAQRPRLQTTVAKIYDAFLLSGDLKPLQGKIVTAKVAKALGRSKLGLPKGMTEVSTKVREATVGLDNKATHAAADVRLVFKGLIKSKRVTMVQNSTLWMQRNGRKWLVIAFDGEMGRRK